MLISTTLLPIEAVLVGHAEASLSTKLVYTKLTPLNDVVDGPRRQTVEEVLASPTVVLMQSSVGFTGTVFV